MNVSGYHIRYFFRSWLLVVVVLLLCFGKVASADAKQKKMLIGIEPEHNIFDQVQRYRALAKYLSAELGLEVKLTIMSRYGELVKRFRALHLDGAILHSYTASLAMSELGLAPVANVVNLRGEATTQGYIFVRKDSGIKTTADMQGKSMVFVDPATTEGYIFAKSYFRQQGIESIESFFSRHYFSGSHASAIFSVLDGRADIGAANGSVFNELVKKDRSILSEMEIIAKSEPVPGVTLCVKNDLNPQLIQKLQSILFSMDQSGEGYKILKQMAAKRFVRSNPEDFRVVEQLVQNASDK